MADTHIYNAGKAVLASSANKSFGKSPISAQQAYDQVGKEVDLILDAGKTGLKKDSTIIDMSQNDPIVLREGAILIKDIFS